jgi:tetratricopeptide (TPR) repeat protein
MPRGWAGRSPALLGLTLCLALLCSGCALVREARVDRAVRRHVDRGDLALALREPVVAEQAYRSALAARPGDVAALHGFARAEAAQGRYTAALGSYARLAERAPDLYAEVEVIEVCPAVEAAAEQALASGRSERALALARRADAAPCASPRRRGLLSRALAAEGARASEAERPEAADLYAASAAANPEQPGAYASAAILLLEQGRRHEALALLSDALERHPRDEGLRDAMLQVLEQGSTSGAAAPDVPAEAADRTPAGE